MLRTLSSFVEGQVAAARDFLSDVADRGSDAAARLQRDASAYQSYFGGTPADAAQMAVDKLRQYGITPEMIAGFAGSQMKHLQRTAFRQAGRHPGSIVGALVVLAAVGAIAYAMTKDERPSAPHVIRS